MFMVLAVVSSCSPPHPVPSTGVGIGYQFEHRSGKVAAETLKADRWLNAE